MADLTPEHASRRMDGDLHPEVRAAYKYVESVIPTADAQSPVDGYAWHGWSLREAFLAGCTHARTQPPVDGEVAKLVTELRNFATAYKSIHSADHIWRLSGNGQDSRLTVTMIARAAELLQCQRAKPESPPSHYLSSVAPLLWLLWRHQGARSPVGRPIREYLGMGQFQSMTDDEIAAAKQYLPNQSCSVDPRNDPDYDTFPYGTEPLPGDTTWTKAKSKKENVGGGTDPVSPEYLPPV